ncbi:MAG TPA: GxxExxY protein [bacterium]|nr:GxxExxY protein [bacterium]HPN29803.1 GxxExxY protein [bacterium]
MHWDDSKYREITGKIIGCFYTVHKKLGPGFLEKAYHNALLIELKKYFDNVESEKIYNVFYDNEIVATHKPDIIVENSVIIENKTVKELNNDHKAQIIAQLRATNILIGFLVNFSKIELDFERYDNFNLLKTKGLITGNLSE